MGKYMRKRAGRAPAAELAQVAVGVSTRARSAAAVAAAPPAPKRPRKQQAPTRADQARPTAEEAGRADGGTAAVAEGCYLHLRSRKLPVAALPAVVQQSGAPEEAPVVVAGGSRCSSTASSVDVAAALERSDHDAAELLQAREEDRRDVESAVSDSAGCRGREGREATPSSRPPVHLSDEECSASQAAHEDDPKQHHCRRMSLAITPTSTTAGACRTRTMPPAHEIEEFFGAAEKAEAERFAAKYNFDVARGLPLGAGLFEWTPVASG